jgi:hypothetical protein
MMVQLRTKNPNKKSLAARPAQKTDVYLTPLRLSTGVVYLGVADGISVVMEPTPDIDRIVRAKGAGKSSFKITITKTR